MNGCSFVATSLWPRCLVAAARILSALTAKGHLCGESMGKIGDARGSCLTAQAQNRANQDVEVGTMLSEELIKR